MNPRYGGYVYRLFPYLQEVFGLYGFFLVLLFMISFFRSQNWNPNFQNLYAFKQIKIYTLRRSSGNNYASNMALAKKAFCYSGPNLSHPLDGCDFIFRTFNDTDIQENLESPMPWIGTYIAVASEVCSPSMVANAFHGFRNKMFWFPCKYFSLNATSLTLLTVAMKLPVDFTESMLGPSDKLARLGSLFFMSIAMANFMTSLGSMDDNEILLNLIALGILVIICNRQLLGEDQEIVAISFMFLSLVIFCSSTLMVPTNRSYIETKYQEMHRITSDEERMEGAKFTVDRLRVVVKKYWVMAVTGSPEFVLARSVTCTASGLICVFIALFLVEAHIQHLVLSKEIPTSGSNYKWSIKWILATQFIGVFVGTIAPAFRWFTAASFKCSKLGSKSFESEFKIENYWIQRPVDWKERPLPLQVRHLKGKKLLHAATRLILNLCIGIQILNAWVSKLVLLISASSFHFIGEVQLPKKTIKNIWNEVDKLIRRGKRQQPKNLIKLLSKSNYFNGLLRSVGEGLSLSKVIEKSLYGNGALVNIRNAADIVWMGVELYRKWQDKDLCKSNAQGKTSKETLEELSNVAEMSVMEFLRDMNDLVMANPLN
ncbi:Hypothetical predicted protein [Olea europaea subsp. europaea]|uniref:Uncharacterized protein n=1 Tax=Olea europaea subsp. europaea TaxID=158383 RepID=A0A8S0Q6F8_OLEEU|nr:Hypothetical predicted protein [Olea europaea subsp. europaea]